MKQLLTTALLLLATALLPTAANAQTWERKSDLPCLYINVDDGTDITSKEDYKKATIHYAKEDGTVKEYLLCDVRGRGNSTWGLPKKPYRLKFASKEKFLGDDFAKAKSWTLLANCGDKTMIRNAVTSAMGAKLGLPFNPAAKFCDLVLNGQYLGTYQISDQMEVRPKRVEVTEQDVPLAEGADITGGYLLEVDGFADGNVFRTNKNVAVVIHYPDEDDIVASQNQYIANYVRQFETKLFSANFKDPELGYRPMIDSTTLARWYIATEVSANIDGLWSTYFYKDQGDPKLYWGPLWDYDIAYANDDRKGDTSRQLIADVGYGDALAWVQQMWRDPWFGELICREYSAALAGGLTEYMLAKVDSLCQVIDQSKDLNYQKWQINKKYLRERVLYSSFDQYVDDLRDFITTHNAYLAVAFAIRASAKPTAAFVPGATYYRLLNKNATTAIEAADNGNIQCWANTPSRLEQDWAIAPVAGAFTLTNRATHKALADPTPDPTTATTNTGTQLATAEPDPTDDRQLWQLTPQGSAGCYNLTNVHTQHTANLTSGNTANGTAVISYTTDSRNATSANRLWLPVATDPLSEADAIAKLPAEGDYALLYDSQTHTLRFAGDTPQAKAAIYDAAGRRIAQFATTLPHSIESLAKGTYIIRWNTANGQRSCKVQR